jgi:hypothetical protein
MRVSAPMTSLVFTLLITNAVTSQQTRQGAGETASLSQPRKDGQLDCAPDAGTIYRCTVSGTATSIAAGHELLLWVRPVQPPSESEGWYLQRRPNGVLNRSGSSWNGKVQIGSRDYPPHDGDIVDIAVSIADKAELDRLMREAGTVIKPDPSGAPVMKSENVRLRIPTRR